MTSLATQRFDCETREDNQEFASIEIHYRASLQFGICIDAVAKAKIRRAIEQVVAEAITIEAQAREAIGGDNGQH